MISAHTCPLAALGGKETGGMNVYVREVARQLGSQGISVDVFTRSQNPKVDRVVPLGPQARVIHIPAGPEAPYDKNHTWVHLPQFCRGIADFVHTERTGYDIVHSHYWLSGWAGLKLMRDLGVPLAHMFHTLGMMKNMVARSEGDRETDLRVFIERKLMTLCDLIVASSAADKAHMVWYYGADPEKIEIIPCGVDLGLFNTLPRDTTRDYPTMPSRRVILFVGRIQPIKGLDSLLRALAILIEKSRIHLDDFCLLIIGGDLDNGGDSANGEMRKLRGLTSQLGLTAMVKFLGAQPQHVLPRFYSTAEICVLPSLYESFGMVALESMACGTPVIASKVGGLNDIIKDGETGYLVTEGNPTALAEKIDLLLQDDSLRALMGRKGVRHSSKYSWENITHRVIDLYGRLLSRTAREDAALDLSLPLVSGKTIRSCPGSSS